MLPSHHSDNHRFGYYWPGLRFQTRKIHQGLVQQLSYSVCAS